MRWTGKVIGGAIGLLALGPFGAALGAVIGHQFDQQTGGEAAAAGPESPDGEHVGDRFFAAVFRVMGYVAKSDGRVSEAEIAAARGIMRDLRLEPAQVRAAIAFFTAGKQPGFDLADELRRLRSACTDRPDLLRIFVEIQVRAALAGCDLQGPARAVVQRCARELDVSLLELAQIEVVLRIRSGTYSSGAYSRAPADRDDGLRLEEAYRVLGVESSASDDECARAYRRQLSRHHPDKLKANGLPESMLEHAKQRTQQIIEAWELVRERRGIRV